MNDLEHVMKERYFKNDKWASDLVSIRLFLAKVIIEIYDPSNKQPKGVKRMTNGRENEIFQIKQNLKQ